MTPWLLDGFPFDLTDIDPTDADHVIYSQGGWGGPITPETEAARIQGLKNSWVNADDRREAARISMTARRPTMPLARPHLNGMTDEHKANLAKAQLGNSNAKKPHKYPATRKSPTKRDKTNQPLD